MPYKKHLVAHIKRGIVGVNPDISSLPSEYVETVLRWKELVKISGDHDSINAVEKDVMARFLANYLCANFVPENIDGIKSLLHRPQEVDAMDLSVTAFSFDDDDIIPAVNAEANFELVFKKDVTQEALSDWEESNGDPLAWCLNFYWSFDEVDSDDWEGYLDTNDGVEMYLI
jgi:hypothetical protein